jgi:hypothetical protein
MTPRRDRLDPLYRVEERVDSVIAPAAVLASWMRDHGLGVRTMAAMCARLELRGAAEAAVVAVLAKDPLTPPIADMLARGTRIKADFWLILEHDYRAGLAAGLPDVTP